MPKIKISGTVKRRPRISFELVFGIILFILVYLLLFIF